MHFKYITIKSKDYGTSSKVNATLSLFGENVHKEFSYKLHKNVHL